MTFRPRTPDWYYGPWQEEYMIWSVYNKPWLIENSKADWTASAIVITPDWSTHTAATTPDWTERVQPID